MTTQLATALAQQAKQWGEASRHATEKAKAILATLILPQTITHYEIERYYRKAHRTQAWRNLPKEARALIQAARKTIKTKVRSPTLHTTLTKIFLQIELHTLKAKALLKAITKLLTTSLTHVLTHSKNFLTRLLVIGLNSNEWFNGWST